MTRPDDIRASVRAALTEHAEAVEKMRTDILFDDDRLNDTSMTPKAVQNYLVAAALLAQAIAQFKLAALEMDK
jgi:hypothetical protein